MPNTGSENSDEVTLRGSQKGIVYEVQCKDCPCVYIGETGRTKRRMENLREVIKRAQNSSEEAPPQEWHYSTRLGKPTPRQLESCHIQGRRKALLKKKGAGVSTHLPTASDL